MACAGQIAETQAALLKARQEELRSSSVTSLAGPGPEVNRWMALKSIAEARSMLQTLFRAAAEQKAQVRGATHSASRIVQLRTARSLPSLLNSAPHVS